MPRIQIKATTPYGGWLFFDGVLLAAKILAIKPKYIRAALKVKGKQNRPCGFKFEAI